MTKNGDVIVPDEIRVLKDVSNQSTYQNRILSKTIGLQSA